MDSILSSTDVLDRGDSFRQHPRKGHEIPASAQPSLPDVDILDPECFNNTEADAKVYYPREGDCEFFVPWDRLLHMISPHSVRQAMTTLSSNGHGIDDEDIAEMVDTICFPKNGVPNHTSFRRILGILANLGRAADISAFVRNGVGDSKLPLSLSTDRSRLVQSVWPDKKEPLDFLFAMGWKTNDVTLFFRTQFAFISPFFVRPADGEILHYRLHGKDVLPIVEESNWLEEPVFDNSEPEQPLASPSRVKRVQLHPEHYDFGSHGFEDSTEPSHSFAMKKLDFNDMDEFKSEVEFLKRISRIENTHLNQLLVTCEIGCSRPSFHLFFPWAESDLYSFWKTHDPHACDAAWIAQQCAGIASGLARIHDDEAQDSLPEAKRLYGRHGDVKPRNILWFPNHPRYKNTGGILVLNDFGLGKYHSQRSRSRIDPVGTKTSLSYRPPECDVDSGRISRKYDIWCLGATYLEFIVWYLMGWTAVSETFPEQREETAIDKAHPKRKIISDCFFQLRNGSATVHPAVTMWIGDLRQNPRCTTFLRGLLELIETGMLVDNPEERLTARELADDLHTLELEQ